MPVSPAPYPMLFEPIYKEKVWGGRTLTSMGRTLPDGTAIGESWELADLPLEIPGGRSVVRNGPWAGRPLREAIEAERDGILGAAAPSADGGFPLLIKFLDARENLSVQVHPSPAYAAAHPGAHLKSEAWVVLAAEPGAVIYKGLHPGVRRETFAAHIESGAVVDDLVAVPVAPGDCHYLPSGTCHALGAGVLVAEVQTPSDTTFRVYDWGREGRELHIEPALACIDFGDAASSDERPVAAPIRRGGVTTTELVLSGHFGIERIEASAREDVAIVTNGRPEVWMVVAGSALLQTSGLDDVDVPLGTTVLLPAALEAAKAVVSEGTSLLRVTLPSPIEGMLASS